MALTVNIVAGYNNYDSSKFVGDETPLMLDGSPIQQNAQDMAKFVEFLKTNSPDLSNYDYKDWTDEVRDKVKSVVENTVPTMRTTEAIRTEASKPQNISVQSAAHSTVAAAESEKQVSLDDLNLDLDGDDDFNNDLYSGL
jgi:hypothetical protein